MNNLKAKGVFSKTWWKAAGLRAVKTMAQTFVAMSASAIVLQDLDWMYTGSAVILAGVLSVATSIAGIPEVTVNETETEQEE